MMIEISGSLNTTSTHAATKVQEEYEPILPKKRGYEAVRESYQPSQP
jgi:hypothetical protein